MPKFLLKSCQNPDSDRVAEVRAALGLGWEEVYASPEGICALARAVRDVRGQTFCLLPFCHTVEAEAMGARVNLGDEVSVARAGEPACSSLRDVLGMELSLDRTERLPRMLQATSELAQSGEKVMYSVSGPLSILSCLMDLSAVFREWRREPELVREALAHLREQVAPYALAAARAGAASVEVADPPAAVSIVGPRVAADVAALFTTPLIEELGPRMPAGTEVVLCPLAATEEMRSLECANVRVRCPKA
ncbi:uroporphyrinogen decarboxylase family protein [Atopobiaceae bacterium HCP3S3_F7]